MRKIVDATRMLTHVPATKPPEYNISEGVHLVSINKLAEIKAPWKRYVVIGAGKTGLDALLHLIDNNVDPQDIVWIVPNDSWFISRDGFEDVNNLADEIQRLLNNVMAAKDINDVYRKGEELGMYIRLDKNIWPTKMRAATMSSKEIKKIRRIGNIIRFGRIDRFENDAIIFKRGDVLPTDSTTLHIDCSTSGSKFKEVKEKIFTEKQIYLQILQMPPSATSAAMIAALELK